MKEAHAEVGLVIDQWPQGSACPWPSLKSGGTGAPQLPQRLGGVLFMILKRVNKDRPREVHALC